MLPVLAVLLAQEQSFPSSSDLLKTLGPFSAAVLICGLWIRELTARLKEARAREIELTQKLLDLSERTLPALAESTRVTSLVADELKRRSR